ncbi:mucin-17-like [Magallana gigas]|uniref:mucin-17-like n=1 Tax=Magallana gigas TaxID=29159 RepID=UPI00333F6480
MPYQTTSSLSGFPSQAPSNFQSSVSQASALPTTSVPIPQSDNIPFNGQGTIVNVVPSTTNIPIQQGSYVPFNGLETNVNIVPSTNSVPVPQGSYVQLIGHSTNLNIVPTAYTNSTPIPQGGYLPISGQGTNVNNAPTNNASIPQGGYIPISDHGTNANMVPLTNIAPVPHGGSVPFSGQGTNSNLVTVTTPQAGYIPCTGQGVDLNVMSQTLYQPVQSTQNSNTSNQYVPCTPNQAMLNSTKQQVLTQNHIQPPPGFQQLLTQQVYTQALPTPISIQQQQQHNLQTLLNQKTTPTQQYTIQQLQNANQLVQVHQQTQLRDVPCQNTCMAPALMQHLTPGLTDQVSPTLLNGSDIPPPGAGLTVTGSIQYQVNPAKLQGGYEPLMASASTESIPGNMEKSSNMQMFCYNSESVQTVGALKPLTVEVSDQGSSSLSGNILLIAKASVCSDHARNTQPHGSKQTLMLLQQCQQPHLQGVLAPLLALQLPPEQYMAQPQHQPIMSLSPHQQFVECSQEQQTILTTIEQQPATMLLKQHLSTLPSSPDHANTKSGNIHNDCGEDDRRDVWNEHEMSDFAEALTDGREQPGVFDTPEEDALLRTVKRHYVEVYQRLSTLKNHVDSLVTDMQTITKGMEAIDLEQNHLKYDC